MKSRFIGCAVLMWAACAAMAADAAKLAAWRNERVNVAFPVARSGTAPLQAAVGDFVSADGTRLPVAAQVRFVAADGQSFAAPNANVRDVWVTVNVPKDAVPGTYAATLTVAGGTQTVTYPITLDVYHDVLPDFAAWSSHDLLAADRVDPACLPSLEAARWLGLSVQKLGMNAVRTQAVFAVSATSRPLAATPQGELVRESFGNNEKARDFTESGYVTWYLPVAVKRVTEKPLVTPADYADAVKQVMEAIYFMSTPASVNGRRVERFLENYGAEFGYASPIREVYLVQHPKPAFDRPGRPLYVVLHSAGHNAVNALLCTRTKGNHDIYLAPDDFFALFLDCKMARCDWWWGSTSDKGFALSPCERRLLATIEKTIQAYGIDRDRVYLCGNSMGGSGTLGFGLRHGDVFAAAKANVPAHVDHVLARLGVVPSATAAEIATIPDPPVLVDYSGTADKYFLGHETLLEVMRARRYPAQFFWGDYGHCNSAAKMASFNDLIYTLDWTAIRKNDIYAAFTDASCDTPFPLPFAPGATPTKDPGQINGFFRWANGRDTANGATIDLFIADLTSRHFIVPPAATTTVTLRRLHNLKPRPGDVFKWTFGQQSGTVAIVADGLITIPGLRLTHAHQTLTVSK